MLESTLLETAMVETKAAFKLSTFFHAVAWHVREQSAKASKGLDFVKRNCVAAFKVKLGPVYVEKSYHG